MNKFLSRSNMEGPLVEINLPAMEAEWNGAIAYLDRDGVLNIGSPEYINSKEELVSAIPIFFFILVIIFA